MTGLADLERDLLIVACAISAGIHAVLAPDHFAEGTAAGLGFAGSAVLLAGLAVALTRRAGVAVVAGAAVTLAGLLASYGLAVTLGVPLLHPEPERVEGLALFTKSVEALGLLAATDLTFSRTKGTLA